MNSGMRHSVQRSRRVKLKHDTVVLLDRIAATTEMPDRLRVQLAEIRLRLQPPTGVKVNIVHTDFTKGYRLD